MILKDISTLPTTTFPAANYFPMLRRLLFLFTANMLNATFHTFVHMSRTNQNTIFSASCKNANGKIHLYFFPLPFFVRGDEKGKTTERDFPPFLQLASGIMLDVKNRGGHHEAYYCTLGSEREILASIKHHVLLSSICESM